MRIRCGKVGVANSFSSSNLACLVVACQTRGTRSRIGDGYLELSLNLGISLMPTMETQVAVIGGGLVGSLQALFLAKRGFHVDLYEKRLDIRTLEHGDGKNINLALSLRGREALKEVGLEDIVLKSALPMSARMIHSISGECSKQYYGCNEQSIYSVDRLKLNKLLLSAAKACPNVNLHFEHQLVRADLNEKRLLFTTTTRTESGEVENSDLEVESNFIVGCDGAFSCVRRQMMRWGKMNYKQEYIEHGYKELNVRPANDGTFAMDQTCLHIWPRGEFMMIALPNQDHSFAVTLFMPFSVFNSIKKEDDLLAFFEKHFEDSIQLIGTDELVQDYFKNPTGSMITVKCRPHFMADSTVILGDAAHAVVPFYAQGMNSGFEDCLIFYECLVRNENNLSQAAAEYCNTHWKDTHAIADLSIYNYTEMRSHVNSTGFVIRKFIDNLVHAYFPNHFIPLYSMVAFSRIPYSEVVIRHRRQQKLLDAVLLALKVIAAGGLIVLLYRYLVFMYH